MWSRVGPVLTLPLRAIVLNVGEDEICQRTVALGPAPEPGVLALVGVTRVHRTRAVGSGSPAATPCAKWATGMPLKRPRPDFVMQELGGEANVLRHFALRSPRERSSRRCWAWIRFCSLRSRLRSMEAMVSRLLIRSWMRWMLVPIITNSGHEKPGPVAR